jgi:hypothetical protein
MGFATLGVGAVFGLRFVVLRGGIEVGGAGNIMLRLEVRADNPLAVPGAVSGRRENERGGRVSGLKETREVGCVGNESSLVLADPSGSGIGLFCWSARKGGGGRGRLGGGREGARNALRRWEEVECLLLDDAMDEELEGDRASPEVVGACSSRRLLGRTSSSTSVDEGKRVCCLGALDCGRGGRTGASSRRLGSRSRTECTSRSGGSSYGISS